MTARPAIRVRGARQNNLRGIDLDLPLGELHVVTGVSGSGKSSLAFDTVYSEGQRRYVETFSSYARQFLDRMDKPRFDESGGIDGIPPSIAIDQTNPVRTSRSTVGTMTELNDHLKLLFARAAVLHCRGCGTPVRRDTPRSVMNAIRDAGLDRIMITFDVPVPDGFSPAEIVGLLAGQGYTRVHREHPDRIEVIADRLRLSAGDGSDNRARTVEAIESALKGGRGRLTVYRIDGQRRARSPRRFSTTLHCAGCDIEYREPIPSMFSFNSPLGACETCRGFGRTMGIDYGLVVPDESKTLGEGAIRPWLSKSYRQCQGDLVRYARRREIALDRPWRELDDATREWVLEGEAEFDEDGWYGVRRYFDWLETKSYRMHIRVLLSRYRSYRECPTCRGARLKPQALLWRVGTRSDARKALGSEPAHRPPDATLEAVAFAKQPGLCIHDVMRLPLERCRRFFDELRLRAPLDDATELLLAEIRGRLGYLVEVGLGYLTLDRQSRTLSGGEVQRINLTTALGTSLVNTLFVLDEPSIGLHARDIARIVSVLHKLREAGNTLLVVEHDPQVMLAADRIVDMGPGPGERGGEIVFRGTPRALLRSRRSLTAAWLRGERRIETRAPASGPAHSERIEIRGARAHNLAGIDVDIPLRRFVCVTGVSGSGKSTLAVEVLYRAACKHLGRAVEAPGEHRTIDGLEAVEDAVLVDQSPIGKTTRSNPASYVGALDAIRKRFAAEPIAIERGYTAGTFSFNSGNGRCPSCGGNGFEHVEMQFLSDVYLRCPDCDGRRYRSEVLDVKILPPVGAAAAAGEVRDGDTSRAFDVGARTGAGAGSGASGRASTRRKRDGGTGFDAVGVISTPRSIADILELTVDDALAFFAGSPGVVRPLAPLAAVGLGYLRLGQPVPALSGGEAQRLKLARHLAAPGGRHRAGHCLFIFDEPTTGLHLEDVSRLLAALDALLAAGHSVLVIEHHLDVIAAADWIVDLGPEGGSGGGRVVATGRPGAIARRRRSHTGSALRAHFADREQAAIPVAAAPARSPSRRNAAISIRNAREHNLHGTDIDIPRDRFTVITGVSGSGKSTVAFDILFAEGQRRYLESLNAYARQFVQPAARPDVDAIFGIPPSVAIEQRTSRGGYKSTVGTMTEIHHFLRLLFVRLGTQHCPECEIAIEPQTLDVIVDRVLRQHRGRGVEVLAPLVVARKGYYTELARWAARHGHATLRVDGEPLPTDAWPRLDRYREHDIDLPLGTVAARADREPALRDMVERALGHGAGRVRISDRRSETLYSTMRACPGCGRSFDDLDPRLFSYNSRHGWCPSCYGTGRELRGFEETETGEEAHWSETEDGPARECRACAGRRLRPEALAVHYRSHGIAEVSALDVETARKTLTRIKPRGREAAIASDVLAELGTRLDFLCRLGLGYLRLDRAAPTLSGGEAQRIRLAAQLGSNLRGVCYILDEPTIGLHARDNAMLLDTLRALRAKGNTVVVVEHDEETIRSAEHVIDLGPGAGVNGGRVVAHGPIARILASRESLTGRHLSSPLAHPLPGARSPERSKEPDRYLSIRGAGLNNLRDIDVDLPLERLVCVTGVSGSGKSSLVRGVLLANLATALRARRRGRAKWTGCREILGFEAVKRVLEVDQTPIGKTPRSCPATYIGIWDHIRRLFAGATESRIRGYGASRFSFNVAGGRCDACEGQGVQRIEMSFLPDVRVPCDACRGRRFTSETLEIRYLDMSIADVLGSSVDEALPRFDAHPRVHRTLALLHDVGLGYLTLGQSSPTLSGGEAQRIKLVAELAKVDTSASRQAAGQALYVLDEPTIGLHMADVEKLVRVLHRLVDAGNTVVVIEHNLDVVAEADTVVDLGPEGGAGGGGIVASGTPGTVSRARGSHTARALTRFLAGRS